MLSDGMPTLADTTVLDAFRRWGYLEAQLGPVPDVSGRLASRTSIPAACSLFRFPAKHSSAVRTD